MFELFKSWLLNPLLIRIGQLESDVKLLGIERNLQIDCMQWQLNNAYATVEKLEKQAGMMQCIIMEDEEKLKELLERIKCLTEKK